MDINTGDGARRVDANVDELRSITDDTSELLDALGYSGDNRGKDVGANVRLGIPQNIAGAPASTKVSRIRRWAGFWFPY
ncbi:MAG: hypothetical protein ACLU37_01660 [Collinsella sp.]